MEAGQLPPPSVNGDGAAGGGGASAYVVEGWLYKRSSSHVHMKDKFLKRWFMVERGATGAASLSYCPSPEDRTLSKDPLVRKPPS